MFSTTSRYAAIPVSQLAVSDDRSVAYVQRRFLPPSASINSGVIYSVTQGERLDNLTARFLGDPEQFWRICDANDAMLPGALTANVGRRLRIPLPQGI